MFSISVNKVRRTVEVAFCTWKSMRHPLRHPVAFGPFARVCHCRRVGAMGAFDAWGRNITVLCFKRPIMSRLRICGRNRKTHSDTPGRGGPNLADDIYAGSINSVAISVQLDSSSPAVPALNVVNVVVPL